jgi:glutamate dehydrogenase/leucine dehydrogenase
MMSGCLYNVPFSMFFYVQISQAPTCGLRTRRFGMKIVVIGGSGLIGTKLVNKLRELGHEVVAASPTSGVNTITGEQLS